MIYPQSLDLVVDHPQQLIAAKARICRQLSEGQVTEAIGISILGIVLSYLSENIIEHSPPFKGSLLRG